MLAFGLISMINPKLASRFSTQIDRHITLFKDESLQLWKELSNFAPPLRDILILIFIVLAGVFARVVLLNAPMQYDESVTFMDFARISWRAALTDYSLPNNHIFHTLLVRLSYVLLGDSPWVIRLPSFIAGLSLIPLVYLAGNFFYNTHTGLLAAALAAWWPQMVFYAANARGYALLGLFSVSILILAGAAIKYRLPYAWVWIAVISALGLFTVPIMAYPIGIVYLWAFFSYLQEKPINLQTFHNLMWMVAGGVLTIFITSLLYLPALYVSGLTSLFGNPFVRRLSWVEYIERLPSFLGDIWMRFTEATWLLSIIFLIAGIVFALLTTNRGDATRTSQIRMFFLFFMIVMPIQRPEMLSKLFFFSLPWFSVWVSAGWVTAFQKFFSPKMTRILVAACLICLSVAAVHRSMPNIPYLSGAAGEHEQIVQWLKSEMGSDDIVLVDFPLNSQIHYYALRAGLPPRIFPESPAADFGRAFILVNPNERQTIQSVITSRIGSPLLLDMDTIKMETAINNVNIYVAHR